MRWWSGSMPGGPPGPANALVVRQYARWAAGRPHALGEIRVPGFWFRNCALRCLGHFPAGLRKDGRVVLVAASARLDRGSPRTGRPGAPCALARVPCLPASIDVCLAVWEQIWCDRAGLFCGSLAFQRVRRRFIWRGPSRGKTYAYPEGHPQRLQASKRVNPSPDPCSESGGASV